jgi:Peptidase inhibitor I9
MPRLLHSRSSAIALIGVTSVLMTIPFSGAFATGTHQHGAGTSATHVANPKLGPGGRVIVLLKNHATRYNARTSTQRARADVAQSTETGVARQIRGSGGTVTRSYSLINAVAAKVTPAEARALAANSAVQEVVPDEPIRETPPTQNAAPSSATQAAIKPPAGACKANGGVRLEPEALETTRADSDVPGARTARSLGYTGKGVTVAWIADGLDIHNPEFMRNGHTIFTDYQDFSGEGPGVPTGGDEAFLDASAIAAQGNKVYDVSHFSELPLNRPCNIRIEGEAPGVNLVGLNIFGEEDTGFNSSFIQAIQYAVTVDHVNILNESLGGNPYPDDAGSLDAVKAANDAAVAAGTTITTSSGDAGVTNTIGSPSTDPLVISVGGSTAYRFYLTTGYGGARLPGIKGWIDNNISSLSSGGFNEGAGTVSLVAPGDLGFAACSKDLSLYFECADFAGNAIGVEESGGTSESSPVTAGVAALVIQAYREGHGGATPSPAVVKTILTSTADDISAPAEQQGAGLVDAYKAVQLAKSYDSTRRTGHTITSSATNFSAIANPGTSEHFTDTITNSGFATQTIHASTRALGHYRQVRHTTVTLSDAHSPKYVDFQGITDNYEKVTFKVPAGVNRLNASIAFHNASTSLASRVRMDLVDPSGRLASYSLPQGTGNYGNGQVANPRPGTWTAYIESRDSADGGSEGPVRFAASVARFVHFGHVSPSHLTLAPGHSGTVTLSTHTSAVPGDAAGALLLTTSAHSFGVPATTSVPVTLRSLIPSGNESFKGTLTGGNGREINTGQAEYYNLDVAPGTPELNAGVRLENNPNNQFYDELVSPSGDALAFGANDVLTSSGGEPTVGSQLHVLRPAAGQWTLIVAFVPAVSGDAISEPFRVTTNEKPVKASAKNLPDSAAVKIPVGTTRTINVKVKNTGPGPEAFFVDPRLTSSSLQPLAALGDSTTQEPLTFEQNIPVYLVPTETSAIGAAASTTGPAAIQGDMGYFNGDPDIESNAGKKITASYTAPAVAPGVWSLDPTEVGPYSAAGPTETVDTQMSAMTRDFDSSVTSATGDLWLLSIDPTASFGTITVGAGKTATIPVQITASGAPRTVTGTLFIDDADLFDIFESPVPDGNEVAALPYTYTVTH